MTAYSIASTRSPFSLLSVSLLNFADTTAVAGKTLPEINKLLIYQKKNRGGVTHIADRLGNPEPIEGDWLRLTPKDKMPQPEVVAYPKPPKAADGSLIYERIPNKGELEANKAAALALTITPSPAVTTPAVKRRHSEDVNGIVENSKFPVNVPMSQRSNNNSPFSTATLNR